MLKQKQTILSTVVASAVLVLMTASCVLGADDVVCPEYGVAAELLALADGGYVLYSSVRYPETMYRYLPVDEAVVLANGEIIATLPVRLDRVSYTCCCPIENYGDVTLVLPANLAAGTELKVEYGSLEPATVEIPGGLLAIRPAGRGRGSVTRDDAGVVVVGDDDRGTLSHR